MTSPRDVDDVCVNIDAFFRGNDDVFVLTDSIFVSADAFFVTAGVVARTLDATVVATGSAVIVVFACNVFGVSLR